MENDHYIDLLILKSLEQTASKEQEQELFDWVKQSEKNAQYYSTQRKIFEASLQNNINFETESELNKCKEKAGVRNHYSRRIWVTSLSIAASIALLFSIWFTADSSMESELIAYQPKTSIVATDSVFDRMLADSSVVTLAYNSVLSTRGFTKESRELSLVGKAFFDVTSDASRPFSIVVDSVKVTVLGTQFEIDHSQVQNTVKVSVTEGKVKVEDLRTRNEEILLAGQSCVVSSTGMQRDTIQNMNFLAWKTGVLHFEDVSLSEAVKDLTNCYGKRFELRHDSLGNELITMSFPKPDIEAVKSVLGLTLGMDVVEENGVVYIQPKK